jgi:NDP-sugar pyrophosphorylase family protein
MLKPESFFQLDGLEYEDLFTGIDLVWEALPRIKDYIRKDLKSSVSEIRLKGDVLSQTHVLWEGRILTDGLELKHGDATEGEFEVYHQGKKLDGATVIYAGAALFDDEIQIGKGVVIEPGALIKGPTRIGDMTEVRHGAYLRGSCLIGRACVVGHTTEIKNAVMLDESKAGHFAYIGDSILGRDSNLGAGTKLANLKITIGPIEIKVKDEVLVTSLRKFGAILGDETQTGCNSVTSPGTVMGPKCLVAPTATVPQGYHPRRTVIRA